MDGISLRSAVITLLWLGCAQAQTPMEVMSDTPGYCAQLEAELSRAVAGMPAPEEVRVLAENGHRMCRDGEVRAGIARLRRALLTLREARNLAP